MVASKTFLHLQRKLENLVGKAIHDYNMIEPGDKVMVCVSGGKDSFSLLSLLLWLQAHAPFDFSIVAMHLDQKLPGFPQDVLPDYFRRMNVDYHITQQDIYSVVEQKLPTQKTVCSLCARLRRGAIYRTAREVGANKIALGHHREDIVHTFFLNLFFTGKLKTMPPKLLVDEGDLIVIRPLAYCNEKEIARFSNQMNFPTVPSDLCRYNADHQRQKIRKMLSDWELQYPDRTKTIFTALQNTVPSHLADRQLFAFSALHSKIAPKR